MSYTTSNRLKAAAETRAQVDQSWPDLPYD